MSELAERHCVPCEGGVPALEEDDVRRLRGQLDGNWVLERREGHDELVRRFRFKDFVSAVDFVTRLTPIAEDEGHHPDLLVGWGRVDVMLWTHAAGGLTENDFILAAKLDALS